MRPTTDPGLLLLAWTALSWAIAHVNGYFSLPSITLVALGAVAAVLAVSGRRAAWGRAVPAAGALLVLTPLVHLQVRHPDAGGPAYVAAVALSAAAASTLGVLLLRACRRRGAGGGVPAWGLPAVAALALLADLAIVRAAPDPRIDVHTLLQQSSDGLLRGDNLYRQTWVGSTGLTDIYPYLPGTTVLLAPARWLLGDVRLGLVLCLTAAVGLLALLAREAVRAGAPPVVGLLPALVVAYPRAILTVQNSWTEPLLLALLVGCVVAVLHGRSLLAVVLLGLALASKQHVALLLPVAALWPAFGWRRALAAAGVGLAAVAPWLVADAGALWHDAVAFNLAYPVLPTALDLPAVGLRAGVTSGFGLTAAGVLAAYAGCVRRLPGDAAGFATGCALVLLAVSVTNKQSFFNHYTLVTGLLVLAVVLLARPTGDAGVGP